MKNVEPIILALIRCATAHEPTDATLHQVNRLIEFYEQSDQVMSERIKQILRPESGDNARLVQSIHKPIISDPKECYKYGGPCVHDCKGLCRNSC